MVFHHEVTKKRININRQDAKNAKNLKTLFSSWRLGG